MGSLMGVACHKTSSRAQVPLLCSQACQGSQPSLSLPDQAFQPSDLSHAVSSAWDALTHLL